MSNNNSNMEVNLTSMTSVYLTVFGFEESFSPEKARSWMSNNWTSGFYFCAVYVFLIFSIQWSMRNRPSYKLRKALIAWNATLAVFSILGAMRTIPEMYNMLANHGLYHSVCTISVIESDKVYGFWSWMFSISKLAEFGDTMFVVLRKQPLKFLHWYHHVTVLLYVWYTYQENVSTHRWFMVMNYSVHSLMYSYYLLRALRFSLPKLFMMFITSLQILQMVMGCLVNYWAYMYLSDEQVCRVPVSNIKWSACMYFSYLFLFSKFFYDAYLSPAGKKKRHGKKGGKVKSR